MRSTTSWRRGRGKRSSKTQKAATTIMRVRRTTHLQRRPERMIQRPQKKEQEARRQPKLRLLQLEGRHRGTQATERARRKPQQRPRRP